MLSDKVEAAVKRVARVNEKSDLVIQLADKIATWPTYSFPLPHVLRLDRSVIRTVTNITIININYPIHKA